MKTPNPTVVRALKKLGENIRTARLRRGMTLEDFGTHMGASISTARRLENGDPGVALGTLISCLSELQLINEFNRLLDPAHDSVGLQAQQAYLPKRGRCTGLDLHA